MKALARMVLVGVSLPALLALLSNAALAQESRATIAGIVTDPTAAVIPEAKVEVTNTATGVVAKTVANETGAFRLPYLIPGQYKVAVSKAGFKTYIHPGVDVRVAETVEIKVSLQVGQSTETIEVTAAAGMLQTNEASSVLPIRRGIRGLGC